MDSDKIHCSIVGAGIHDQSAVVSEEHGHVSVTVHQRLCNRVFSNLADRDHKPEGTFAGSERFHTRTANYSSSDGLRFGVKVCIVVSDDMGFCSR